MKIAVVLFNLGAPDRLESVEPFLKNLFSDPAILRVPGPIRWFLARLISRRRGAKARAIYAELGGGSPLLAETERQRDALARMLSGDGHSYFVTIAMRYWHPLTDVAARAVKAFAPERIVLLPLYPQFSTTTTASSFGVWSREAVRNEIAAAAVRICCYGEAEGWIAAQAETLITALDGLNGPVRVLFSAHGLPEKIVADGDPYQWQVEQTAVRLVERVKQVTGRSIDSVVCYQSKVGPLTWIGPSTEHEIERAGRERVAIVVVPLSFVSEHSETLVELDITYRELATKAGVPTYRRAATVGTAPAFIGALAAMVRSASGSSQPVCSAAGRRRCPTSLRHCGFHNVSKTI